MVNGLAWPLVPAPSGEDGKAIEMKLATVGISTAADHAALKPVSVYDKLDERANGSPARASCFARFGHPWAGVRGGHFEMRDG